MDQNCRKRNDDYFGKKDMFTKDKIACHIADICSIKNDWHDGAISSHILATLLNKYYRMSI